MKKSYIKPAMTTFNIEACHPLCMSIRSACQCMKVVETATSSP